MFVFWDSSYDIKTLCLAPLIRAQLTWKHFLQTNLKKELRLCNALWKHTCCSKKPVCWALLKMYYSFSKRRGILKCYPYFIVLFKCIRQKTFSFLLKRLCLVALIIAFNGMTVDKLFFTTPPCTYKTIYP